MNSIIISDLHIGSNYFFCKPFEYFIERIPEDCDLILNGDIIDKPYHKLQPRCRRIMEQIKDISFRQRVIWIQGNHDNGYIPEELGMVEIKSSYSIEDRLLITHGDYFDKITPHSHTFLKLFRLIHNLRLRLGAQPVHVAEYAKKWELFYKILRKNVMSNATNYAKQNGFEVVACGHTHYAEDRIIDGVRYINTGAWTELPLFYLLVTETEFILKRVDPVTMWQGKPFT